MAISKNTVRKARRSAGSIALSVTTVACSLLGFAAVSAGPAQAVPTGCTWTFEDEGNRWTWAQVKCRGGSGYYRAWVKCPGSGGYVYKYGPTVSAGRASKADCGSALGVDYGKNVYTYPPGV
ncbi:MULTISPECIES: hypothetical protein [Streptomyces]|uniref:Uncharacterized protein n=1 Tax=Streptomyces glycanivorans TaxID=3033808 RepID=A0ABY9JGT3_9ACTN|nr:MULTISPECIES: hypothetical protein [unclassified Streptomyces]WSQ79069.1 hypothetical protein OG725_19055 [Streptomyces sp. NBC_01213]TXS17294.1 hypothetical protein EAO68_05625 [Streptomyces sp. wa22]WLQ65653.1 hypothetical protein P8A20_19570 [Streptomyces sp. Alt3]WSQ86438.1 hypothetical protein OG722_19665 [Streptomyces sp. NBC_01212]WSR07514.1 hypothetical protein OG265_16575 [Streptomyces sp. NBC_01208]